MALITVVLHTLPGVPEFPALKALAEIMVAPFLDEGIGIDDGPSLNTETGLAPFLEDIQKRPNFTSRGLSRFELRWNWNKYHRERPDGYVSAGSIRLHVSSRRLPAPDAVEMMLAAQAASGAVFGFLSDRDRAYEERASRHVKLFQEGKSGADRMAGLSRGMSGIPWRSVVAGPLADYLGRDALSALPASLARRAGPDSWLLTPCETCEAWTRDAWCDGEAEIIAALGPEKFFNPGTGDLPSHHPALPPLSLLPVKTSLANGRTAFHNGYRPTEPELDTGAVRQFGTARHESIETWNRNRQAYMDRLLADTILGYVPTVIYLNDPTDDLKTAFVMSKEVAYVVPEVDVILFDLMQIPIPWEHVVDALAEFEHVSGTMAFSQEGKTFTMGLPHFRGRSQQQHDNLLRAMKAWPSA